MLHAYRKYRVAISLAADQVRLIDSYRAAQRHAYNWAVGRIMSGGAVSEYGLYKELTAMRREQEWMRAVPAWIQRAGIQDACTAHKLAARFGGGLRHRTRKRHSAISVRCALAPRTVDRYGILLPSFGTVRAAVPKEAMEHEPRSYEFTRTRSGRYVLYVSCRVGMPPQRDAPADATVKGVDRGVAEPTVVVTMDRGGGAIAKDSYDTAAPFRDGRAEYQEMQSRMSKMSKHSNRLRRLHARLRRRLQKTRSRRQYAECVAAKHVCDDHAPGVIVLEDLKVSSMTRRGRGSHKRGLNREMRFVRHRAVEQRIRNRAELAGIQIITVDPRYTSQECARCGHVDKSSRVTRDMFRCTKCSYVQQADVNAAMVIGGYGLPPTDPGDTTRKWQATGAGTALVRRELDARLNCFSEAVGGPARGHESQVPARSLSRSGMEKERQSAGVVFGRAADYGMPS